MRRSMLVVVSAAACSGGTDRAPQGPETGPVVGVVVRDAAIDAIDATAVAEIALPGHDLQGDPLPIPERVSARLGSTRLRQGNAARWIAWSRDGTHLVTAGSQTAWLWSASTGELIHELWAGGGEVEMAAVSPDAQIVVGGYMKLTAWRPGGDKLWAVDLSDEELTDLVFSPDGRLIAASSVNFERRADHHPPEVGLRVFDAVTGELTLRLKTSANPPDRSVAFSPDGELVAISGRGTHVYDLATGKRVVKVRQGGDDVAFTTDGKALLWSDDHALVRFDLGKRKAKRVTLGKDVTIEAMSLAPDGATLVVITPGQVRLFDPLTLVETAALAGLSDPVITAAHSPDGQRLALAVKDRHVRMFDLVTGGFEPSPAGHAGGVTRVVFAPAGDRVATGGVDSAVIVWDLAGNAVATVAGHTSAISGLAFTEDGSRLVSADAAGGVIVSTVSDGARVAGVDAGLRLTDVVVLPDGRVLLATGEQLLVWTIGTAPVAVPLDGHASVLALSPDGSLVFGGSWNAWLLDSASLTKLRACATDDSLFDAAFSPDGKHVAVAAERGVQLIEVETGKSIAPRFGKQQTAVAWAADGSWVATGGWTEATIAAIDRTTWNLTGGLTLDPWTGRHYDSVSVVDVSPDGRRIVTGHSNGAALIWSAEAP